MTYKKSQYNVLLNSKHYKNANGEMEYPIFNTATGCFGAMDEKTSLIYNATDMSPECEGCKFLPMCQSACPLKRLDSNKKNCYHMSLTYKKALEIAYSVHTLKKLPSSTPSSKDLLTKVNR